MSRSKDKSLMRSLGEFFGHVYKAIRTDPAKKRVILKKTEEEEKRGDITLRRTTIDEIEFKEPPDP